MLPSLTREQSILALASLLAVAAVAVSFALWWTKPLMVPFVLAFLVSELVQPLVDFVQVRLGAPRWVAILWAFLTVALGSAVLISLLWASATGLSENADLYTDRLARMGHTVQGRLDALPERWVPRSWTRDELDMDLFVSTFDGREVLTTLGSQATDLLSFLSQLVADGLLVTMFSAYLIAGRPPNQQRDDIWGEVSRTVRSYLVAKFAVSAVCGTLVWLVLASLGLDLALVFGVLTFLLNFVPNFGPVVATLLPVPLALVQFAEPWQVAAVVLLPGAIHTVLGNLVEPLVIGERLDLHPITVLLTLIFWGLLWGPVGMLLATPLTAVFTIALDRFETTRPVAEVLAGRLPTPSAPRADAA